MKRNRFTLLSERDEESFDCDTDSYDNDANVDDLFLQYEVEFPEATKLLNGQTKEDTSSPKVHVKYPKSVFFIIGNEFCERFSYYGMRAILILYLKSILKYDDSKSIEVFHGFVFFCYFTPLFGAILADGFLGKFRTILYVSIVYATGNVVLAAASVEPFHLPTEAFSVLGLFLIAVGTGGIKPCVSSFGGDQFEPHQETELENFFSVFYFAINAGSVLSMIVTPRLRADVHCFGNETCFSLAFGVPAILMVVALLLFIFGKKWYRIRPAEGTVIVDFFKCIWHALTERLRAKGKKEHWLDYSEDKFSPKMISNTKAVLRVLLLYIPVPFFWSLFDQTASRWVLQATYLDGKIPGTSFWILPDQIGVINPLFIMVFIPLFEYVVYPLTGKIGLIKRPLQRMLVGGILAAIAYIVAGVLQMKVESSLPILPGARHSQVTIINTMPCNVTLNADFLPSDFNLAFQESHFVKDFESRDYKITVNPNGCHNLRQAKFVETFNSTKIYSLVVGYVMVDKNGNDVPELTLIQAVDTLKKSPKGEALISITYLMPNPGQNSSFAFENKVTLNITNDEDYGSTNFTSVKPGSHKLFLPINVTDHYSEPVEEMTFKSGAVYRMTVVSDWNDTDPNSVTVKSYTIVKPNSIHMLWQLPQYLVITASEIMFSITGLQFSYSQAPLEMKSVLSAAWLMTVAFGNIIIIFIELIGNLPKQSYDYFLYSGLMGVDMVIFAIISYFYEYVSYTDADETHDNEGFSCDETTTNL